MDVKSNQINGGWKWSECDKGVCTNVTLQIGEETRARSRILHAVLHCSETIELDQIKYASRFARTAPTRHSNLIYVTCVKTTMDLEVKYIKIGKLVELINMINKKMRVEQCRKVISD